MLHHWDMLADCPEAMPIHRQVEYLQHALSQNPVAQSVLTVAAEMQIPHWYFGAGGVAQSVWNLRHSFEPLKGIKDYDLVYFDPDDLSAETEGRLEDEFGSWLSQGTLAVAV